MNTYWIGTDSVYVGRKSIRPPNDHEVGERPYWPGTRWGVFDTPLHRYPKKGSLWVGSFNGESNFWSVRVGAYCIRPQTYRVLDSMIDRESNSWQEKDSINTYLIDTYQVLVGAYCIRPTMYKEDDSFAHCHGICRAYAIRPYTGTRKIARIE